MSKIRVAIIGVGNSASVFVQSLAYRQEECTIKGIWHPEIGGYGLEDIQVVEAFDINQSKVGKDLSAAISISPNNTTKNLEIQNLGVKVSEGLLLDELPDPVSKLMNVKKSYKETDIAQVLKKSNIDVVLNVISSGLDKTTKAYAEAALKAGCSFINCTPSPIVHDSNLVSEFEDAKQIVVGDDLMSQFGGTVFHKGILDLMIKRGVKILKSYQLDVGGGAETLNTINEDVKRAKRKVKSSAISSEVPYKIDTVTGTTDYVDFLGNNRTSYYWLLGEGFNGSPITIDIYLRTSDGSNAVNILLDLVRVVHISKERERYGAPNEICGYGFKRPPIPIVLEKAYNKFEETFLK